MPEAVIVSTARTPIGRAGKGSLAGARPDDMSAFVIQEVLARAGIDGGLVEDVIWGCARAMGEAGNNIGRVAGLLAGLRVPGVTVNRFCASSLQTIRMAAHAIKAGEGDCFIAGGVESVSHYAMDPGEAASHNTGFREAEERTRQRATGDEGAWQPAAGLPDIYISMGHTAENVAQYRDISRARQDEFACASQNRAEQASKEGFFAREISPYRLPDGTLVSNDDGIRPGTTQAALASLRPVFLPNGTVTAGNACPLNDGAAAVLVMSERWATDLGLEPLARIVSTSVSALDPEIMGLGPVEAVRQALHRAGKTVGDIDLFEINEAFSAQVIACADELEIPMDRLNVKGGAIALGHPFGMTGARIMTTLLNGLSATDGEWGVESMCIGGGQGMAMVVQRLR
jgi:acetyl-CoA C-acetyltransferase